MKYLRFNNKLLKFNNGFLMGNAKASGGLITQQGNFIYHTFLSTGNLTIYENIDVSVLLVGGGGGRDTTNGSKTGAGGGEVKELNISLSPGIYCASIGSSDSSSYFYNQVANKGHFSTNNLNFPQGYSGSGFSYGGGLAATQTGGGGGDTSIGKAGDSINWVGGQGGNGRYSEIVGKSFGGGGGGYGFFTEGLGIDGGGNGESDGIPNTGGGCGGIRTSTTPGYGGSGIIVIRYDRN